MPKNVIIGETKAVLTHRVAKQQTESKTRSYNDDALDKVMVMVNSWLAYRSKLLPIWERDTKLYNNERVNRLYHGVADTFVPMTYSTLEQMSAALLTGEFNTDFLPQDIYKYLSEKLLPAYTGFGPGGVEESEDDYLIRAIGNVIHGGAITDKDLEILNALYDYAWDKGDWDEPVGEMIDSGLEIGNGATWMILENGLPKLIGVPFQDYIFDPTATSDETCAFAGRRYLASLKSLREEKIAYIDENGNPRTKKRYNLSGLKKRTSNTNDDRVAKELMEQMLYGSTVEIVDAKGKLKDDLDQCEVIEIMTRERMYAVINRCCLAEDAENFILAQARLKGIEDTSKLILIPGTTWANNKKGSMFIGRSETSTFWQEQERLNDSTNQKSDAVTRALLQTYRADPALKSQKNSFSVPGAVIWGTQGQMEPIPPAQVPNAAFNEEASIKNNIRETTATDQLVKGVASSSDVTATEAKIQVRQSGERLEKKVKSLKKPLKRIARIGLQYIRLFVSDPFIIPQEGGGGVTPLLYIPSKYNFDFEPKVTLTISAQEKKRFEQSKAREDYQVVIQDPTNNLQEAKEILYPRMLDLDKDETRRIIENSNPATPVPQGEPIGPAMIGAV